MTREIYANWYDEDKRYVRYSGLSSDTKPTRGLITGSEYAEVDTGMTYRYDEMSDAWYPTSNASKTLLTGATVTLGSSLTYTGAELTQTVSSVKIGSTTLTVNTDYEIKNNKATLPGTYTLLIIGKGTYAGVLQKEFTVAKGSGSVSASPDSLSLTEGGDDGESTLTVTGDGVLSVASSDTGAATAALNGKKVIVTPVAEGSATVTVTLADGDLYEGTTETIAVTVGAAEQEETDAP